MKKISFILLFLLVHGVYLWAVESLFDDSFRFAQLTDLHVSRSNNSALEDVRRSIDDINQWNQAHTGKEAIDFVIVTGDITEAGDRHCMQLAKNEFDRLTIPYFVVSGNHETTWSESGCTDFARVFGADRFSVFHKGVFFVGFNSGPVLKMADGHVAPQDLTWARQQIDSIIAVHGPKTPVIAVTHYPLQTGDVDNWYDVTSLLRSYNTQCIIGGHYHRNLLFSADGIPDVLCRSNLRGQADINGYTFISLENTDDNTTLCFAEKTPGLDTTRVWMELPMGDGPLLWGDRIATPSYDVNLENPQVKEVWRVNIGVGIYSAPAVSGYDGRCEKSARVYIGDDLGVMHCFRLSDGKLLWQQHVGSRINSTPVVADGIVVFGSTAGEIVALRENDGSFVWRVQTGHGAVMGCPILTTISGKQSVLIGGNHHFYALELATGAAIWTTEIAGYCVSRPCIYDNKVYFGAWGCYFYALNVQDGSLVWKWFNGSSNDKFSPAAVWPVAANEKIFIVAPDRVFTCLNAQTGDVIYRTKEHMVRENIGISADGQVVYSRCMRDSVQAMSALSDQPHTLWKVSAEYGYDHDPSMMLTSGNTLVFGTKNGLMHGVRANDGKLLWRHKIGNCVVNTVCPLPVNINGKNANSSACVVTSSDGAVVYLRAK
ncbi:MAG: PQQ-binding-like beta-propeller repeat protein [Paludibacteraceae bacterium]|nr:PQQ-binding-like beta-propeller repeat protein [Paludibacteraceae bacterium]